MCGFVGVASSVIQEEKRWLTIATKKLLHRGPDDYGVKWLNRGKVGLGHSRLSIIDLSFAGHQPFVIPELNLAIVFNGEIYNYLELQKKLIYKGHKFISESDTEVLLRSYFSWGSDCLKYFNGMFSFVIYDLNKEEIFLARDRSGEKPLFYRIEDQRIFFASELKALFVHPRIPRKINLTSLDCYLSMGFVPGSNCILDGFNKLPPACAMIYKLKDSTSSIWRYWHSKSYIDKVNDTDYLVNELELLLDKSVDRQLVSDVPIGVLLSGGIDSSIITALASRHKKDLKTFSVCFQNSPGFDETKYSNLIANHFGTDHLRLYADDISTDVLCNLARQIDEPIIDSSMLPTWLLTNLVSNYCKVALGGDGADELFGGYKHYIRNIKLRKFNKIIPLKFRQFLANSSSKVLPLGFKFRDTLQEIKYDTNYSLPLRANFFDSYTREGLMKYINNYNIKAESIYSELVPFSNSIIERALKLDYQNYLPEDILVKTDRTSMLNSMEMRSPFLDINIVEFAQSRIPESLKVNSTNSKIILKKLAKKLLPDEYDLTRKQGFSIPLNNWLRSGPYRTLFHDVLYDEGSIFNRDSIKSLFMMQEKYEKNSERLFALVLFELWRNEYDIAI